MVYWLTRRRNERGRCSTRGTLRIWGDVHYGDEPLLQVLAREVQMLTTLRVDLGGIRRSGPELRQWLSQLDGAFRALGTRLTVLRVPSALAGVRPRSGSA